MRTLFLTNTLSMQILQHPKGSYPKLTSIAKELDWNRNTTDKVSIWSNTKHRHYVSNRAKDSSSWGL